MQCDEHHVVLPCFLCLCLPAGWILSEKWRFRQRSSSARICQMPLPSRISPGFFLSFVPSPPLHERIKLHSCTGHLPCASPERSASRRKRDRISKAPDPTIIPKALSLQSVSSREKNSNACQISEGNESKLQGRRGKALFRYLVIAANIIYPRGPGRRSRPFIRGFP